MQKQLRKFVLPIGIGLVILTIAIMVVSTTFVGCAKFCSASGDCLGTDNECYSNGGCQTANPGAIAGSMVCATSRINNSCSATPNSGGIYCCQVLSSSGGNSGGSSGGSTPYCSSGNTYNFSSQMCCPNGTPYYYPGTHGISAPGCYAQCPYIGDCGTMWQKY